MINMQKLNPNGITQYKLFSALSMIYITVVLAADVLIYKIIQIGPLTITAGSLITPFWFIITDMIAEIYGYRQARKLIWIGLLCSIIFTVICSELIRLPSPADWQSQGAYDQILGKLPLIFIGYMCGVLSGGFINSYLIAKWKILIRGKYFWLRSMGSSGIGQLTFTAITIMLDLFGVLPFHILVHIVIISFVIKLIVTAIVALPSTILVGYIKKIENIDVYDYNTDFNPFKFDLIKSEIINGNGYATHN